MSYTEFRASSLLTALVAASLLFSFGCNSSEPPLNEVEEPDADVDTGVDTGEDTALPDTSTNTDTESPYECIHSEDCDDGQVCIDATCVSNECGEPSTPPGTSVSIDGYLPEDRATYECEPEHDLVGDQQRTCLDDGSWSGNPPGCIPFKPPQTQTLFTYPSPGEVDDSIEDHVISLLDSAPAGSKIRASFYSFSRVRVANAFVDAHNRGADVEVIVNNHNVHPDGSYYAGVGVLDEELGGGLTVCNEDAEPQEAGCVSPRINHNKFILFSELQGGSDHVVMQTSANMNNPQRAEANSLVTVHGDEGLYDAYLNHWNDQKGQQIDPDYYHYVEGDYDTKVYFFPRQDGDTIVEILDEVSCDDQSRIHVNMAFFSDARTAIAERLADLDAEGCAIHVLVADRVDFESPGDAVVDALSTGNIDFAYFPHDAFDAESGMMIHSKYFLIDAPFGANQIRQQLVFTGSHNFNVSSLERNDEALLRIRDSSTHADFVVDWETLRPHATTLHP